MFPRNAPRTSYCLWGLTLSSMNGNKPYLRLVPFNITACYRFDLQSLSSLKKYPHHMILGLATIRIPPFPFPSLLDPAAGGLCLRCSSGTTFPHSFPCSVRLQGSRPTFEAPFSFVSLPCTPVINFVLLLFVPVNRRPLC